MRIASSLARWPKTTAEARALQVEIREHIVTRNQLDEVRLVAGVDISYSRAKQEGWAGVVVLEHPSLKRVEERYARGTIRFPYVPGLLSFREGPLVIEAFKALSSTPDLVLFDGQGVAHPRGCGLASHLGVLLDIPSVGVAKSRLLGTYQEPAHEKGSYEKLVDSAGEVIGAVVRTRWRVKPIFVSVGHKVDLPTAIDYVLSCCRGYRIPEPTRQAHLLVRQLRKA